MNCELFIDELNIEFIYSRGTCTFALMLKAGWTSLMLAARGGFYTIIAQLLEHHADCNLASDDVREVSGSGECLKS